MTIKYTSIKSILYNLSLLIDDKYWNEDRILEWAARGVKQLNITQNYIQNTVVYKVVDNKVVLPTDLISIIQVFYTEEISLTTDSSLNLPSNSDLASKLNVLDQPLWKPMKSNNLSVDLNCLDQRYLNRDCQHSYAVSASNILSTTLKNGYIGITYLSTPIDTDGIMLIPDDETVKEALIHYVLYYYWLSKFTMKEDGAELRVKFHLDMWQTLSMKAKNLNLPSVDTLEKMRVEFNSLVPKRNHFQELFLNMGKE